MSEETATPETVEPVGTVDTPETPAPAEPAKKPYKANWFGEDGKKKFRPSMKMRAAIFDVLARSRMGWAPEYKIVAVRHNVNWQSLETIVRKYHKGMVELGDPPNMADKKEIDLRGELERSLNLLLKYEQHLNDTLEMQLDKAKKESKAGNAMAYDQLGCPKIVAQLNATAQLRAVKEKGVMQILQGLLELQHRREAAERLAAGSGAPPKQANGITLPSPSAGDGAQTYAGHESKIHEILGNPGEE